LVPREPLDVLAVPWRGRVVRHGADRDGVWAVRGWMDCVLVGGSRVGDCALVGERRCVVESHGGCLGVSGILELQAYLLS
jgi:hypothetical protein